MTISQGCIKEIFHKAPPEVLINFISSSPPRLQEFHLDSILFSRAYTHSSNNNSQLFDRYEWCMMERHIFLPYFFSFFNRIKFPSLSIFTVVHDWHELCPSMMKLFLFFYYENHRCEICVNCKFVCERNDHKMLIT